MFDVVLARPCRVSAEMYSAPSIVMQTRGPDGALHIFDDFREGYAWLRSNTAEDAIIASWCAGAALGFRGFGVQGAAAFALYPHISWNLVVMSREDFQSMLLRPFRGWSTQTLGGSQLVASETWHAKQCRADPRPAQCN